MLDCTNTLTLFGSTEDMENLKQAIKGENEVISFESYIPSPQELIESTKAQVLSPALVEKYGSMDINSWRLSNWGCVDNAYSSVIVKEDDIDLADMDSRMGFIDKLREINAEKAEEIKNNWFPLRKVLQFTFKTEETPTGAVQALSKKFPKVLVHFGYDSLSEDVCGWANLRDGEIVGHQHFDNSLRSIRLHVEPFSGDSDSLFEGLLGGDASTSN